AGPGARELTAFFDSVDGTMAAAGAPNVAASDQHLLNLLSKRAKILHIGVANFCSLKDPCRRRWPSCRLWPVCDLPVA
ncbi:MAG TPA: hypothetical protein VK162_11695, partial [Streptosporangiaceae bacterium]|nr:hypothetical protein [Streptosporangiaceae bacterium]